MATLEKYSGFFTTLNIRLPHDSAIVLLGIYPREMEIYVHTQTSICMFIAALLVIAPVIVIDKIYIYIYIYTYLDIQMTKIYFSYICGFTPQFLAHSFQKPCNFLSIDSDKGVFCE